MGFQRRNMPRFPTSNRKTSNGRLSDSQLVIPLMSHLIFNKLKFYVFFVRGRISSTWSRRHDYMNQIWKIYICNSLPSSVFRIIDKTGGISLNRTHVILTDQVDRPDWGIYLRGLSRYSWRGHGSSWQRVCSLLNTMGVLYSTIVVTAGGNGDFMVSKSLAPVTKRLITAL